MPEEHKTILVTGGAGFVGSHLVDSLMNDGHKVIVWDDFSTGSRNNLKSWGNNPNLTVMCHDVSEPLDVIKVDQIYHLASPASPKHYMLDPVKTLKTNTLGTMNILEIAMRFKAKFLLASTSEVYGDPLVHPQAESYWGNTNPIGPRSCYDEGKRASESMAFAYKTRSGVNIKIARIFNTYGPRMQPDDGRVVSNFIIQSLNDMPITIYGDGSQTRSFQYVSDLIVGLKNLMAHDYVGPVNLGNPHEITVLEFAKNIKQLISTSTSPIVYRDLPVDDPHRRKPDIRIAIEHINWSPKVCLTDGLRLTIEYFKDQCDEKQSVR